MSSEGCILGIGFCPLFASPSFLFIISVSLLYPLSPSLPFLLYLFLIFFNFFSCLFCNSPLVIFLSSLFTFFFFFTFSFPPFYSFVFYFSFFSPFMPFSSQSSQFTPFYSRFSSSFNSYLLFSFSATHPLIRFFHPFSLLHFTRSPFLHVSTLFHQSSIFLLYLPPIFRVPFPVRLSGRPSPFLYSLLYTSPFPTSHSIPSLPFMVTRELMSKRGCQLPSPVHIKSAVLL